MTPAQAQELWYQRSAQARAIIRQIAPYYLPGVVMFRAHVLDAKAGARLDVETLAVTERFQLYVNAEFIKTLSGRQLATVLMHEIHHVLRRHPSRTERFAARYAHSGHSKAAVAYACNLAADAIINADLDQIPRIEWPSGDIAPCTFKTLEAFNIRKSADATMEELAQQILKSIPDDNAFEQAAKAAVVCAGKSGGLGGHGLTEATAPKEDEDTSAPSMPDMTAPPQKSDAKCGDGGDGGGQDNGDADGEGDGGDGSDGGGGGARDGESRGGADGAQHRTTATIMQQSMIQAVTSAAKASGTGTQRLLNRLSLSGSFSVQLPWPQILAGKLARAKQYIRGHRQMHFSRPSRRQAGLGYGARRPVLGGLVEPRLRLGVVLDTSGSMSVDELSKTLSTLEDLIVHTTMGRAADVEFIATDIGEDLAPVQLTRKVDRTAEALLELVDRRGGTEFAPALAYFATRPVDVVLYLTDGYGDAGPEHHEYKLIWLLTTDASMPWGDEIHLDVERSS